MTTITESKCRCGTHVDRKPAEGAFADIFNQWEIMCPECSLLEEQQLEVDEQREREEDDRRRFHERVQVLPPALRDVRLHELDTDGRGQVLDAARRWARGELKGLALIGDVGVGKTTIAAATTTDYIGRHLNGPPVRWISTTVALSDLSRDFKDQRRIDAINALTAKTAPLILDDLDKGKPTVFAAEQVFNAIDLCLTNRRPLIVTTNLMPSQLEAKWPKPHGEAIASRIAGYCEMHRVTGRDRRTSR